MCIHIYICRRTRCIPHRISLDIPERTIGVSNRCLLIVIAIRLPEVRRGVTLTVSWIFLEKKRDIFLKFPSRFWGFLI